MPDSKNSIKSNTIYFAQSKGDAASSKGFRRILSKYKFCTNQAVIIIGSFIFGIIIWFADALLDYLTIPNISFINLK